MEEKVKIKVLKVHKEDCFDTDSIKDEIEGKVFMADKSSVLHLAVFISPAAGEKYGPDVTAEFDAGNEIILYKPEIKIL